MRHDTGSSLWSSLETAGRRFAGVALTDTYGRSLTFRELRDAALDVAAGLQESGVGAGTRVSWQLPTSMEAVVLMAALSRLGAVQNPLITSFREAELTSVFGQFPPAFVFTVAQFRGADHRGLMSAVVPQGSRVVEVPLPGTADSVRLPRGDRSSLGALPESDDSPRWVYVTSGSTAEPKTLSHSDRGIWATANALSRSLPIDQSDVIPIAYPISHAGGVAMVITSLRTGCMLQLIDIFDPVRSPLDMAAAGATILGSATPFFDAYLAAQRAHGPDPLFPHLKFCVGGGAPVAPHLVNRIRHELGGLGVANGYGLTECPTVGFPIMNDEEIDLQTRSAWFPGPGVEVRIIDTSTESELSDGHEGELRLRAPQMFVDYLAPELRGTGVDGHGFVRTGDLAIRGPRGEIEITGRIKEIVIRNGENISLPEVEAVLLTHPLVADVSVVGMPDVTRGERCCATVVPVPGLSIVTLQMLRDHCDAAGLARYKAPEQLEFLESIPRSSMGKVLRSALRESLLRSLPSAGDPSP